MFLMPLLDIGPPCWFLNQVQDWGSYSKLCHFQYLSLARSSSERNSSPSLPSYLLGGLREGHFPFLFSLFYLFTVYMLYKKCYWLPLRSFLRSGNEKQVLLVFSDELFICSCQTILSFFKGNSGKIKLWHLHDWHSPWKHTSFFVVIKIYTNNPLVSHSGEENHLQWWLRLDLKAPAASLMS